MERRGIDLATQGTAALAADINVLNTGAVSNFGPG